MKIHNVNKFTLLLIVLITNVHLLAQPVDSILTFFPIHIGDKWQYQCSDCIVNHYTLTTEVTGDTIMPSGLRYWTLLDKNSLDTLTEQYWIRLDSVSGSVYKRLSADYEIQLDSLRAKPGEYFYLELDSYLQGRCADIRSDTILNLSTVLRYVDGPVYFPNYKFAYGLGLVYYYLDDGVSICALIRSLIYAKIDGIEYGTPSSVENKIPIPLGYVLRQNHPNPFNPSTIIEFSLPQKSYVRLSVYNVIGQTVSEWIYPEQNQGNYSITWTPYLASGIYFYKLEAVSLEHASEHYSQTRKMLLLK